MPRNGRGEGASTASERSYSDSDLEGSQAGYAHEARRPNKRKQPDEVDDNDEVDEVDDLEAAAQESDKVKPVGIAQERCVMYLETAERVLGDLIASDDTESFSSKDVQGDEKRFVDAGAKAGKEMFRMVVYKILTQLSGLSTVKVNGMFFSGTAVWKSQYTCETHIFIIETERALLRDWWGYDPNAAMDVSKAHHDRFMEIKRAKKQKRHADKRPIHELLYRVLWTMLLDNPACRAGVAAFIGKERSAFVKKVSKDTPKLEKMLCESTGTQLDLLRFAGVPADRMPTGRKEWMPHDDERLVPIRKKQKRGGITCEVDERSASSGISLECIFKWTLDDGCKFGLETRACCWKTRSNSSLTAYILSSIFCQGASTRRLSSSSWPGLPTPCCPRSRALLAPSSGRSL